MRIILIFLFLSIIFPQTTEELRRFRETYDQMKVGQEANEVIQEGIESDKDPSDGPVKLLIKPGDMTKYYLEKMKSIKEDLKVLNELLIYSDSIPPLQDFGYNYFLLRDSLNYVDNANVSNDYVLGYGDEVMISVWGQAEQYERKIVERDGTVFIDNVGLLYLAGKTQIDAKSYIENRFSKVYSSIKSQPQLTFIEFSIGKTKNINISISGHVKYPGNYVVNPSISIPNILILSGGITSKGTLRNIYLQRSSSILDTLDLYPLMTGVGLVNDISIAEGDIIIVPPRGETVAITGNIMNPAYYEIIKEENVSSLLNYAGSINKNTGNSVIIARSNAQSLFVDKEKYEKTVLIGGDSLIVPKIYNTVKSISVSVTNRPIIEIPWNEDLTFNQILNLTNIKIENILSAELIRINKNNQELYSFNLIDNSTNNFYHRDHVTINLRDSFFSTQVVIVKGEINLPGSYPIINSKESLNSVLKRAGGLKGNININNVVVKRDTLKFGSSTGELLLSPGDTIIAFPYNGTIKVEGEVHKPGIFEWTENKKAKDYLSFAGGLTSYGDKKHIIYITPFGEAKKIKVKSNNSILPGGTIRVSEKPISNSSQSERFQQLSNIVTSLVSIAILANTYTR